MRMRPRPGGLLVTQRGDTIDDDEATFSITPADAGFPETSVRASHYSTEKGTLMALTGSAVTTIIHAQHLDVGRLLETVGETNGATRARQFHDLRVSLAAHEAAEELAVHPRCATGADTNVVAERIAEEHDAAEAMGRLEQLPLDSAEFDAALREFAESVHAHANAEQAAEWPIIEAIDDPHSVDEMATTMRAVYELTASADQPSTEATFADILAWARRELPNAAQREPAPSTSSQRKVPPS